MNNEKLEMELLLMKYSIEQLQEELAINLKTRDSVLLRYMYSYLLKLATNKKIILKLNWKN